MRNSGRLWGRLFARSSTVSVQDSSRSWNLLENQFGTPSPSSLAGSVIARSSPPHDYSQERSLIRSAASAFNSRLEQLSCLSCTALVSGPGNENQNQRQSASRNFQYTPTAFKIQGTAQAPASSVRALRLGQHRPEINTLSLPQGFARGFSDQSRDKPQTPGKAPENAAGDSERAPANGEPLADAGSGSTEAGSEQMGMDENSSIVFLEKLLAEMEGGEKSKDAPEKVQDDPFLASLRLRLAQEYVLNAGRYDEAEKLAILSWEYYDRAGAKGDIAITVALHTIGLCKLSKGYLKDAAKVLRKAIQAARECRESTLAANKSKKRPLKQGAPRAPLQPNAGKSWLDLLPQQDGKSIEGDSETTRVAATSLEFSCHMMLGEISEIHHDWENASRLYNAAVNIANNEPGLHGAPARQDAYYSLANTFLQMNQPQEALAVAMEGELGLDPAEVEAETRGVPLNEIPDEVFATISRGVREKRLLASILVGLSDVREAAMQMKEVKELMRMVDGSALDLAHIDVATAEILLCAEGIAAEADGEKEEKEGEGGGGEDGEKEEDGPAPISEEELLSFKEEALSLLTGAAKVQADTLGSRDPLLAPTLVSAAEACLQLSKPEEAGKYCNQALELFGSVDDKGRMSIAERSEGEGEDLKIEMDHAAEMMAQTASILSKLERLDDAEALFQKAERILAAAKREKDAVSMLVDYGTLLLSFGKADEALIMLQGRQKKYAKLLESDAELNADFLHMLGCAFSEAGKHEESIEALTKATGMLPKEAAEENPDLWLKVHVSLAAEYAGMGKLEEAVKAQEGVVAVVEKTEGKESTLYDVELDRLEELKELVAGSQRAEV